ncbi:MAG: peptidylprolyl isomerase, partial [Candidatus Neomarinimicrobiota bacterium]
EEVLFQMKNNPPPFLQNSDAFQSFGRFDLEKYLDAVLNPSQIDWKPIEDFMQNVYLPSYKLQQYITNAAAISSKDVLEDYKKRFLDYKIEVLHVTEKAIDQDFYNGLLADRPSNDELLDIYNENILDYDQPELRYLKYVKWPIMSNATDSLRVKLEAEDLIFRLNKGEDFALLANTYTEDPSNSADPQNLKGGDLGWFNKGQLLPEFEIASFEAEKGSIVGPILTQYGYHIIKVNDKRTVESNEQVNASHILLTIQPGRGTENELKDTASIFALEATEYGFFALADSLGLEIQDSNGLRKESIFVDNFGVGRSAVNFAFNNVEGSTSDAIKNDNFFGVFFLDKVDKETVIPFEEVKEDLRNEFLSEFKKNHLKTLAESIKDNNQEEMSLSAIYKNNENLEYVAETNSALIGSFESIGKSNFIVGALADAKEGDILGPLPTLRGQAFLRVIEISEVVNSDFEEKKESIKFSLLIDRQNAIWGNWLQALRDNADLKDYRYDFY